MQSRKKEREKEKYEEMDAEISEIRAQASNRQEPNPRALIPILVFLVLYIGSGIYYEYIHPIKGEMGFYIMSVVVAFGLALIVAFVQNPGLSFDKKIHICAKGIGDDNITIMLFIFLMAGAFSGIAKEAGGVESTANLLMNVIPGRFAIPGLFVIACLISMSMGTSVGTITVLVPIAASVAGTAGFSLPMCVGTVVGGAMFGDNLSFISDTTIAATKTQGVAMKDKFRANIKIALPAAAITLAILIVLAVQGGTAQLGQYSFHLLLAIPYFIVLILAFCGINVFIVLGIGILLFLASGWISGTLTYATAFSAMGTGTSGMFETMIVTILVASISALMEAFGGFAAILALIRRFSKGKRGAMFGIGLLTGLMDIATANNTVAIVVAGPIARQVSEEYGIDPRKTASLLDTCSCVFQGVIPYGAQLLVAASLAGISSVSIIRWLFYQAILLICVVVSIVLEGRGKRYGG
ncbi:MAG: Na+/H+ antiporter NhaC family protein [Lachnospiraceae bacterium]|jgi:Na+/H+ antiporter NhaC|nr:Na+/H+ antiporter NhaC family protein [Lachnospiraceae bacterium]MCI1658023.1 Na+/H+ antiporter NhaC family protein [Lachnospiraceae bacterium]MCI2196359.1 Na+/H+ antiporter NhaC family protein [Lachnospiraceae bacterium]